jgi:hypothetical protein
MGPSILNNSDVDNDKMVVVMDESTTLINHDTESQPSHGIASDASGRAQDSDTDLWDEMDAPWPATFERAISLLASPVIKADRAEDFTKSPKPGNTPAAIRKKMLVSHHIVQIPSSV